IGSIIEYRNSTIFNSDRSHSFIFNDYEGEDVKSTRIYEDVFPNELSEKYNLDNYQKTIYNDNNDEDPSNDLVLQAPALESLLNFTHTTDAVPAIFDRRILINCPAVIDNILETPVSISIPDSKTDLDRSTATLDVIEVIPDNGKVIIDSNPRKGPSEVSVSGGRYLHYSSAQDGNYDQVFVIDENGDVLAIAIDYDYNFLVEPNKKMLTEKHILATNIVEGDVGYLMSDSRVYLKDNKKHDGIFLDPTFTDSLYDIWKTVYISSSSQLMSEVKAITSRQFVQSVQGRIVEDIAFQVVSQLIAFAASQVLHAIPVVGSVLAVVGYALIYGLISAWKAHQDAIENARDIASFTLKNPSYDSPITLSSKDAYSDLWGGTLPNIVGFSTGGVYTDTLLETDEHLFKGKLVLAPKGVKKTGPLGLRNIPISLDYTIQKGGYTMYSDFDDPRLSPYFKAPLKPIYNPLTSSVKTYAGQLIEYNEKVEKLDPELRYMTNSIMFLERSISEQTNGQYDTIYPYMTYGHGTFIPTFQFGGLGAKFPVPEFYREYPTFVDSEYYSDVKNEYSNIYKVFDMDSSQTIELIPENSIHAIYGDVPQIEAILVDTEGNEVKLSPFKSSDDMFTFTAELGTIHISNFMYNTLQEQMTQHKKQYASVQDYDAYYILKIGVARYRSTDDLGDMTHEEVDHIATMQSIDQTLLEYSYQFTHAQNTQKGLSEMFYTTIVTVVSTIITTIATLGVGAYASKVHSKAMNKAAATIAKETGKGVLEVTLKEAAKTLSFAQRITQSFAGATSSAGLISVMLSPIKETLQEIFVDPYLETIVTDITAKWGWSVFGQVLASSMASATRETLTGSMTQFIFGGSNQQTETQGLIKTHHEANFISAQNSVETSINSKKNSLKYSPKLSTFIKSGVSLLIGAALGGMGGPLAFGATVGIGLASMISIVEDLDVVKTITHNIVSQKASLHITGATPENRIRNIDANPNLAITQLLKEIAKSQGLSGTLERKMIYKGKLLQQDKTLSAYGFISGDSLLLIGEQAMFGERTQEDVENHLNPKTLKQEQVRGYSKMYKKKLTRMAIKYASDLKKVIINEYGQKVLSKNKVALTSIFSFRFDKAIRKVTHLKTRRSIGPEMLNNIKAEITAKFNTYPLATAVQREGFTSAISFIDDYLIFSKYLSSKSGRGAFSISNIKDDDTNVIAPKSWLYENIRYALPKKNKLPLRDDDLSWVMFGDRPSYGIVSKLKAHTEGKELMKRKGLKDLLSIDYRISRLDTTDFINNNIEITNKGLEDLQKTVAFIIQRFVFGDYHESTYVSKTTNKGLEVGKDYFQPEYEIIREIFFLAADANDGIPLDFGKISADSGIKTELQSRLYQGYGFDESLLDIEAYIEKLSRDMGLSSRDEKVRKIKETIEDYKSNTENRRRDFMRELGYRSQGERDMHRTVNDLFGVEFIHEKQVNQAVGAREITTTNDNGVRETFGIPNTFSFDFYLEFNQAIKDYLGLDYKWKAIAVEYMGTYWHGPQNPNQQEADRKKRLICRDNNIILIEIEEGLDPSEITNQIIEQIKEQTGTQLSYRQLTRFRNFIGNTRNP
ncbi:hypothetical protein LCGC14_0676490, partial [marine sediment metagenome]